MCVGQSMTAYSFSMSIHFNLACVLGRRNGPVTLSGNGNCNQECGPIPMWSREFCQL